MEKKITLNEILIVMLRNFKTLMLFSLAMMVLVGALGCRRGYLDYKAYQDKMAEEKTNYAIELQRYSNYVEQLQQYTISVDDTAADAAVFLNELNSLEKPEYTGPSLSYENTDDAALAAYVESDEYRNYLSNVREYLNKINTSTSSFVIRVNNLANIVPAEDQPSVTYTDLQKEATTKADIIELTVKSAVGGFFSGFALMFLWVMTAAFISNRISYVSQLRERYSYEIFGSLRRQKKQSSSKRINRWLMSLEGIEQSFSSDDEALKYAAANIKLGCAESGAGIALVGSCGGESLDRLSVELSGLTGKKVSVCGDILNDAASLEKLAAGSEDIVLIEALGDSFYNSIDAQIVKVKKSGRGILGFLLV